MLPAEIIHHKTLCSAPILSVRHRISQPQWSQAELWPEAIDRTDPMATNSPKEDRGAERGEEAATARNQHGDRMSRPCLRPGKAIPRRSIQPHRLHILLCKVLQELAPHRSYFHRSGQSLPPLHKSGEPSCIGNLPKLDIPVTAEFYAAHLHRTVIKLGFSVEFPQAVAAGFPSDAHRHPPASLLRWSRW